MKQKTILKISFAILFLLLGASAAAWLTRPQPVANTVIDKVGSTTEAEEETKTPAPVTVVEPEPLTILFGGDIFLDRSIRRGIEARGVDYHWQDIAGFLSACTYKIANLEGPIWSRAQAAPSGSFSFAFQPEYVDKLKNLGFTHLSLANNHTLNQGNKGLINSRTYLEKIGIEYFGDLSNVASQSFWKGEIEGRKLALVGEHDLVTTGQQDILAIVKQLDAEGYFVISLPHWGPEYNLGIPTIEKNRAHALIDAGVDLIIGAHPHVVQPVEVYKGKTTFYSLGNFLFDQYFSYDTLHGLLVEVQFEKEGLRFKLFPTEQDKTFQIHIAEDVARQKMLDRIAKTSIVNESVRPDIAKGEFRIGY